MSSKTFFTTGLIFAFLGASYFMFTFGSNYVELEQYAGVTGAARVLLTMATGLNVFNLFIGFALLCMAGLFYYMLRTHKA